MIRNYILFSSYILKYKGMKNKIGEGLRSKTMMNIVNG